ncbi:MAG: hypothetical protein ACTJHU_11000 [Mycetocola sp.]
MTEIQNSERRSDQTVLSAAGNSTQRRTDGAALASLLVGGLAMLLLPFGLVSVPAAVVAVIAALVSRARLKAQPQLSGVVPSLLGFIAGCVVLGVTVVPPVMSAVLSVLIQAVAALTSA